MPFFFAACSDESSSSDSFFSSDETEEAVRKVSQANDKLREIKKILKESENRLEELKTALSEKNSEKVKRLSSDIISDIDIGTKLGKDALAQIDEVQRMNVNDDFKSYLSIKSQSLLKYAEAYTERRALAELLRDKYDPNNVESRKTVGEEFERREVIFMEKMKEAGELSRRANELAKEANSKNKNQ